MKAIINDGLTKSQRETCAELYNYCVASATKDEAKRRLTEATKVAFGRWLMARDKAGELSDEQLIKYTERKPCEHCGSPAFVNLENVMKNKADKEFIAGNEFYESENYKEALKCYKLAAEHGHAGAQYVLGNCYYTRTGVKLNYSESIKWYTLAAEQGLVEAQSSLGCMYYNGLGAPKDRIEALKWFIIVTNQGHTIYGKADIQRQMTDAEVAEARRRVSEFENKLIEPVATTFQYPF